MINYKLAKQLKETGFPQIGEGKSKPFPKPIKVDFYNRGKGKATFRGFTTKKQVYYPTLSELIEACGNEFVSLEKEYWGNVIMYKATGYDELSDADKSPEEAVAKLWLKLQNKK